VKIGERYLVCHLSRGGWLQWRDTMPTTPAKPGRGPLALRVHLEGECGWDLTEAGTQKRLAVYVVQDPMEVPGIARLGPDALDSELDVATLAALLADRRKQIKGLLTEQTTIAGIGNAYSDEILHTAKLSPFKLTSSFTPEEVERLHAAIRTVLSDAVKRSVGQRAATLKEEKKTGLRVHRRTGEACPVCGDTIREVSFSDSALQYCPTCQTGGTPIGGCRSSASGPEKPLAPADCRAAADWAKPSGRESNRSHRNASVTGSGAAFVRRSCGRNTNRRPPVGPTGSVRLARVPNRQPPYPR
jgi:formamidopyrimidine-DNA glycosylase